jgi:hypothetical protein
MVGKSFLSHGGVQSFHEYSITSIAIYLKENLCGSEHAYRGQDTICLIPPLDRVFLRVLLIPYRFAANAGTDGGVSAGGTETHSNSG